MSQVNVGGTTLSFKDSSFTGDQWESVASWVLNGGAEECEKYAKEAKSYAKGGTATREGEDTDNAKYYKEQAADLVADAQSSANVASASEINAEASKEAAAGFAESAKDEADRAVAASAHPPRISSDEYWEMWDMTQSAYVKTSYPSRGPKGDGLKIDGTAPTYAQLPTLTESDAGKAYMVVSDGRLYIWDGTAWPAEGAGPLVRSAYAAAQAGGYTGTETEFNAALASVGNKADKPTTATVSLPASGWDTETKTQTVTVTGVTETVNCIVTAAPASFVAYGEAWVRCTAQGDGTLTFTCDTLPTEDLTANVLIIG